jgi:hypothetical protein
MEMSAPPAHGSRPDAGRCDEVGCDLPVGGGAAGAP